MEHLKRRRTIRVSSLLIGAVLLSLPTMSSGQYDLIAVFSNGAHSDCAVTYTCDGSGEDCGYIIFWIFHYSTSGALGSRFKASYRPCLAEHSYLGDYRPFSSATGNSQVGVTIPYGSCLSGWTHVLTVWYYSGSNPGVAPCCEYPVSLHPEASTGEVEILDCSGGWVAADKASAFVNADLSCPCSTPTGIAERTTTWGAIKQMFHD